MNLAAASFTFHNVSINSGVGDNTGTPRHVFTFHNVSINSRNMGKKSNTEHIYIP